MAETENPFARFRAPTANEDNPFGQWKPRTEVPGANVFEAEEGHLMPVGESNLVTLEKDQKKDPTTWNFREAGLEPGIPSTFADVLGGVANAPRNIAESVLSIRDVLAGRNDTPEAMEWIDEWYPNYRRPTVEERSPIDPFNSDLVGEISQGVGELLVGGSAGFKVVDEILKSVRTGKRLGQAAKAVAVESGAVLATDPETETLVLDLGSKGDTYSEELARKRLNLIAEALVLSKVAESAFRLGAATKRGGYEWLISPLRKLGDKDELKKTVTKNFMDKVKGIDFTETPDELAAKYKELIRAADNFAEDHIKTGLKDAPEVKLERDTVSTFELGLEDDALSQIRARDIRKGVSGGEAPQLQEQLQKPLETQDKLLTDIKTSEGGDPSITTARETVQSDVQSQMDTMLQEQGEIRAKITEAEEGVKTLLREDPAFVDVVKNLSETANIKIGDVSRMKADEIVQKIQQASDTMTTKKNELYRAIPHAQVDKEAVDELVSFFGENLPDDVRSILTQETVSFKDLYNEALPRIAYHLNRADPAKNYGQIESLRVIQKYIHEDAMKYLMKSDNPEVKAAAEKAAKYYREEYAPFWRDNPTLQQIQNFGRQYRFNPDTNQYESRTTLRSTLDDPEQVEYVDKIAELMKRPEAGENAAILADYGIGEMAATAQRAMNIDGTLSEKAIADITRTAEKLSTVFEAVDPKQVERINSFLTKVRDKRLSAKELSDQLGVIIEQHEQAVDNLRKGPMKDFFVDTELTQPKADNTEVFSEVFKSDGVLDRLPEVIKRAGPEGLPGLKAAYADQLKTTLFRQTGSKTLESAPVKPDDLRKLLEAGEMLYADKPETIDAIQAVVREVDRLRGKDAAVQPMDLSKFRTDAGSAIDFMVTQVVGVLNRLGARVRSAAGKTIKALDPRDLAEAILDDILANPDNFSELARKVVMDTEKKTPTMTPETRADIFRYLVTLGIVSRKDETEFLQEMEMQEAMSQ